MARLTMQAGFYSGGSVVGVVEGRPLVVVATGSLVLALGEATPSASGDPYVWALGGRLFKLPDRDQCYRLLDVPGVLRFNAMVGKLGAPERALISRAFGPLAVTGGYFFSGFAARAAGGSEVVWDAQLRVLSSASAGREPPLELEPIPQPRVYRCPLQGCYRYDGWLLKCPGSVVLELRRIWHPQVRNGVFLRFLHGRHLPHSRGLLVGSSDRHSRVRRCHLLDFRPLRPPPGAHCANRALPKETWVQRRPKPKRRENLEKEKKDKQPRV